MATSSVRLLVGRGLSRFGFWRTHPAPTAQPVARPPVLTRYELDRLRLLAEKPRAYSIRDSLNPMLERMGLARATNRVDRIRGRRFWEITEAGQRQLSTDGGPA